MSEVEHGHDPVAQPPDEPVGAAPATPDPVAEDRFVWNGEEYEKEAVMEVVENFGNWKEAQAAITRRNQQDAEQRREVERLKAQYEEKLAGLQDRNTVSTQEDYDEVTRITQKLDSLEGMIRPLVERQAAAEAELQRENAFDAALSAYASKPMANTNEMRAFMDAHGLRPDQADLAYRALYGFNMGQMKGAQDAKTRAAAPVLGSTGYGASPGWNTQADVPRGQKPMSETSVEELVRIAMNDPDI